MLKFFKRKTDLENLNEEYHVLLEKAHIQSKRTES